MMIMTAADGGDIVPREAENWSDDGL